MLLEINGNEEIEDIASELADTLENKEVVELITELYFLLETPERVQVKRYIG